MDRYNVWFIIPGFVIVFLPYILILMEALFVAIIIEIKRYKIIRSRKLKHRKTPVIH